ncbi:MAG: DNA repair protein RadC [Proteobacteria bacterium]|nr:DNA repair protein RadC [Pseudomonadota bacterium]
MTNTSGHRGRLKARFLEGRGAGLADYELLELALTFAIPRKDVKPIAKALLARFGSLSAVLSASAEQLRAVGGVGEASSVLFGVIAQLALRVRREKVAKVAVLDNRLALMDYLYTLFAGKVREEFHVLFLDSKLQLLADETMFTGTLSEASVGPREIVKRALELNAAGLVVAHNHPSGVPTPSTEDDIFTRTLAVACEAVGMALHDHVIVGVESHFSFKGAGRV